MMVGGGGYLTKVVYEVGREKGGIVLIECAKIFFPMPTTTGISALAYTLSLRDALPISLSAAKLGCTVGKVAA